MPGDIVFEAVERLHRDLLEVRALLTGAGASVRLVLTPESVVVAEARRSLTTLSLLGYQVDGVVANRVFPEEDADEWRQGWVDAQTAVMREVEHSFSGRPIWRSAYQPGEPVGRAALVAFADAAYGGDDPLAAPIGHDPVRVERTREGGSLVIALPFVTKSDIDLARHGDELVVTVGSYRRLIALPAALRRHVVTRAWVDSGVLRVRFRPPAGEPA
jgi:arsenite-transporting ATPase